MKRTSKEGKDKAKRRYCVDLLCFVVVSKARDSRYSESRASILVYLYDCLSVAPFNGHSHSRVDCSPGLFFSHTYLIQAMSMYIPLRLRYIYTHFEIWSYTSVNF